MTQLSFLGELAEIELAMQIKTDYRVWW